MSRATHAICRHRSRRYPGDCQRCRAIVFWAATNAAQLFHVVREVSEGFYDDNADLSEVREMLKPVRGIYK